MKHYLESAQAVTDALKTSDNGLSASESAARLERDGPNRLKEGKRTSLFVRFINQLLDPMIIILIAAAVVSGVIAVMENESFTDVFIIMFVVLLNAILGVIQESKAEKAIEALKEMSAATSKVIRDGVIKTIKSEELVVGDVIVLEAGDSVPADARILESVSMKAEEAALTGESVPVDKISEAIEGDGSADVPLGDRKNMVYMGGTIVYGRGRAVVTATGMDTEMGKIADAITNAKQGQTPLQKKLGQLSKILTVLVLGICVFIFAFSLIRNGQFDGASIMNTFMLAVSLAVAAIPEGLAAVVTIVLSMGVTKMSKRNAIIRKLTAVETLGCAQIICSDKTGTLTQNKMTVVDQYADDNKLLATAMAFCSDAHLDETGEAVGEPTECALVNYAKGLDIVYKGEKRVGEAPFDSMRKMMSTAYQNGGRVIQYTKGAPDEILKNCTMILKNGTAVPITDDDRKNILDQNRAFAQQALRVLAAAYKEYDAVPQSFSPEAVENELVFIGLVGMIDPVRPEVKAAIEECKGAGIRAIMITGDHRDTAVAIGKELGIISDESGAITGTLLDEISDEQLAKDISKYSVYARVRPEHKVRIVNAWKSNGYITAMTGDGVNDAPSIQSADIGVGMGITGTDVTKNVADMVLADDNFATIVSAVEEGRRIYDNIRKCIQFLLSSNLSEVISIFVATICGFVILKPVHILWINLITDCFPALALGMEKEEPGLMRRKPRPSTDGVFAGGVGIDVMYQGLLVSILTLAAYFIGHFIESGRWEITQSADGMTMAFLTMSMAEIFHSYNMRSQRGSIFHMHSHNKYLFGAMILSLVLSTMIIYIPFLADLFEFTHIDLMEYAVALGLAFLIIPIVEIIKLIQRTISKNSKK